MTPEQLQAQIEEDYAILSDLIECNSKNYELVNAIQGNITANRNELAIMQGETTQAQIIALTDKNTVSLFN